MIRKQIKDIADNLDRFFLKRSYPFNCYEGTFLYKDIELQFNFFFPGYFSVKIKLFELTLFKQEKRLLKKAIKKYINTEKRNEKIEKRNKKIIQELETTKALELINFKEKNDK